MTSYRTSLVVAALTGSVTLLAPRPAHAGIEACGNIEVTANAQCNVQTQGGCTAQCTPVKMEAACAGKLEATCDGQCNASATVDCTGSCTGSCEGQCAADPGNFDCTGSCEASCEGDCSGKCSSASNQSECQASCNATCRGSCSAKCSGTPPSATCEGKCKASCDGSCQGRANIDCQVKCQSSGYAQCKATLEGGCKTKCTEPSGALFCDGQYVDAGNNLQSCIDALNAMLHVKVQASGSANCAGNECNAEGKATASCGASPGAPGSANWIAGALGVVAAVAMRRRRARG